MCYATKRKIADCVKELMRKKEIRKISIQDIMHATDMSRQSFYYHFKDIYDVITWIGINDFGKKIIPLEVHTVEEEIIKIVNVLRQEKKFAERIVREVEWPIILKYIRQPLETIFLQIVEQECEDHSCYLGEEGSNSVKCFNASFCYYFMDYIYQKKDLSDEEILKELRFMIRALEGVAQAKSTILMTAPMSLLCQ